MQNFDPNKRCYVEKIEEQKEFNEILEKDIPVPKKGAAKLFGFILLALEILIVIIDLITIFSGHKSKFIIITSSAICDIPVLPISIKCLIYDKKKDYIAFYVLAIVLLVLWLIYAVITLSI